MTPLAAYLKGDDEAVVEILDRLTHMRRTTRPAPFAPELMQLAANLSTYLLNTPQVRRHPELQVLGFWLRPAALETMKREFVVRPGCLAVAQGLVFHIPPANVDTIFAYSLFMSFLCGNANIVRIPSRRGAIANFLLAAIRELFRKAPQALRESLFLVSYDHDTALTGAISSQVDLRVVWGGDETVRTIRAIPLAPWGRELIFPNRFSWSAIDIVAYKKLLENEKEDLALCASKDLFWFDQNACSSPRIIVWRGVPDHDLMDDFYRRVDRQIAKTGWQLDTGSAIQKKTQHYAAMVDYEVTQKSDLPNGLTVFRLSSLNQLGKMRQQPCFGGTLFEYQCDELANLAPFIERGDQTLSVFGFSKAELKAFVRDVGGYGFDRIVPVGQALAFDVVWDGYDLPQYFTRLVRVQPGGKASHVCGSRMMTSPKAGG